VAIRAAVSPGSLWARLLVSGANQAASTSSVADHRHRLRRVLAPMAKRDKDENIMRDKTLPKKSSD
jgi:hypothetical protein